MRRDPNGHRMCRTFRKRQVPRISNGKYYLLVSACLLDASLLTLFVKPITPVSDALTTATPVALQQCQLSFMEDAYSVTMFL